MRKVLVGLIVVGLLAVASPARAQIIPGVNPGSLDPLGLVTSGAVLPFVGGAGNESWLEAYSPVTSATVHMFFFNDTCVRGGDSINLELTPNDAEFLRVDNLGVQFPTSGLITAAGVDSTGFFLEPTMAPVFLRLFWVNVAQDYVRVLEPIALSTWDNDQYNGTAFWNPLRTATAFFAPPSGSGINTTIYFICPNTNIIGTAHSSSGSRAFATADGFPPLVPAARIAGSTTPLQIRVFDDDENFLRDVRSSCNCFSATPVTTISSVYSDVVNAPFGTYSEVSGDTVNAEPAVCGTNTVVLNTVGVKNSGNSCDFAPTNPDQVDPATGACPTCTAQFEQLTPAKAAGGPFSFTAYRSMVAGSLDVFNRLGGACVDAIQGGQCTFASDNLGVGGQGPNFGR